MKKKATLTTISNELGISVGTISRILNGKAKEFRISEKTVEEVLAYAKEVGYSPNLLARSLRNSKSMMLGLIVPDISNPFFARLAKEIEHTADQFNYSMLFVDSNEDIVLEKHHVETLLERKVDGIIAAPVGVAYSHFEEVKKQNTPLVIVDRYAPDQDIPYFASDNYLGAKTATQHLIEKGHKRIALIKGDENMITAKERLRGYTDALLENQLTVEENLIVGDGFKVENGIKSAQTLFDLNQPPSAIFAMSNQIGLGVLEAAHLRKLLIPEQVSLIVFDDQPYASYIKPPLSTVKQDIQQIGKLAVDAIISIIDKPGTPIESALIKPSFIERASVRNLET